MKVNNKIIKSLKITKEYIKFALPYILIASSASTVTTCIHKDSPFIKEKEEYVAGITKFSDNLGNEEISKSYVKKDAKVEESLEFHFYDKWDKIGNKYERKVLVCKIDNVDLDSLSEKENYINAFKNAKTDIIVESKNDISNLNNIEYVEKTSHYKDNSDIIIKPQTNKENNKDIINFIDLTILSSFVIALFQKNRKNKYKLIIDDIKKSYGPMQIIEDIELEKELKRR